MTKEQRAARKPLLAKIRRLKEKLSLMGDVAQNLDTKAQLYWRYYKGEMADHYETKSEMRRILIKAPGTKFWMEDKNRAFAEHKPFAAERKPAANPETCISIPNGGTPPRAPRQ